MESSQEKGELLRQRLYTTIFGQSYSPCGKYLATCDNFGNIAVFSLASALSPDATEENWKPVHTFKAHDGAIHSLVSTDRLLVSGGTDCIKAWLWSDVITKSTKVIWAFNIDADERLEHFTNTETNSLALASREEGERLFAGCGDNNVHVWDISSGQQLMVLRGHTDYLHSVTTRNAGQECVSASEDGTARIFDTRIGRQVHVIEPYKDEKCARSEFGKWLGCVAVDKDDWLVCGGGPRLCLWHLRSLAVTTVFDTPGAFANSVMFNEDTMISAGSEAYVRHWTINGEPRLQVPCSQTNVFSLAINDKTDNNKVLSIAGNSAKLDICTNFGYKAFSLSAC